MQGRTINVFASIMMGDTLYSRRSPSDRPVILGYNMRV